MPERKNYAWPVTATSKNVYDYFETSIVELTKELSDKKIVVFGAGIRGTLLSIILEKNGYNEFYFTDNNSNKWGGNINGHFIIGVEDIYKKVNEVFVLIAIESCSKVEKQLEERGFIAGINYKSLDTSLYDFYMEEFNRKTDGKVLIMGDCGLTHISLLDKKKDNLGDLIKQGMGNNSVKVLAMHGMGMNSFYHILKTYMNINGLPQIVVIMANFDTFTGKQHLLPRSQHVDLLKKVYACSKNTDKEFEAYIIEAQQRMENFQVEIVSANQKEDIVNRARVYMRYNYMYHLKEDNENIIYLKKIVKLLTDNNRKVFIYIPPVNYQLAEKVGIADFKESYNANVDKLKSILDKFKCQILDFSYMLSEQEFSSVMTADETANYEGRCKQASKIIQSILKSVK